MRNLLQKAFIVSLAGVVITVSFSNKAAAADAPKDTQTAAQPVDLGPADAAEQITISVHLNKSHQEVFDKTVEALYEPGSAIYEKWLTDEDLRAYAPTPSAVAAVEAELVKAGLKVLSVDPFGFSIRAVGSIDRVQKAFQTEIHNYSLNNGTFRRLSSPAILTGGAHEFVKGVAGLTGSTVHPMVVRVVDPKTGKAAPGVPLTTFDGAPLLASAWNDAVTPADIQATVLSTITDVCITAPQNLTMQNPYGPVTATYHGNVYAGTVGVNCSFQASQLQNHYGLQEAYKAGYTGEGQTIVIVDPYGYPTMLNDANTFSALYNLPYLNSTNFRVVYPDGPNPNPYAWQGWSTEIALDIQTVHTIAPKAKIILVAAFDNSDVSLLSALLYVTENKLGTSISNSWGGDYEGGPYFNPATITLFNDVLEVAAAKGISFNFATGDAGDNNNGNPVGAPSVPSDSPYATAVGGTSILNAVNGHTRETGWGSVLTVLSYGGYPNDPPSQNGFRFGAGGGESIYNPKPSWQSHLPGVGRQVPDVSALADPYTGATIVVSQCLGCQQEFEFGVGGTSLASPIFSAFWALATEAAGHTLGQAAPKIAKATEGQIKDVLPVSSSTNPLGFIIDQSGTTYYSPYDLIYAGVFAPNSPSTRFTSAIWPNAYNGYYYQPGLNYILAFGLDTSLTVTNGWDNVTGFGVPNGLKFIEGFK